jgi:hypothetical protein
VKPVYVKSDDNIADGLTKPLDRVKFEKFRTLFGVQPYEELSPRRSVMDNLD